MTKISLSDRISLRDELFALMIKGPLENYPRSSLIEVVSHFVEVEEDIDALDTQTHIPDC